ncbi:hypothetical protein [Micromonospora globbae]|uniref:hypothetical protein n=1 Tax=Micromonospora globbae TaxID=1894969 RepID=UPI00343CA91B
MARTRWGNSSAYWSPSSVPYELPWKVSRDSPSAARTASRSRAALLVSTWSKSGPVRARQSARSSALFSIVVANCA